MFNNSGKNEEPRLQTINDIMTSNSAIAALKYRLPSEFFEKVLDCEVSLKEKFDPKIFFELINYYSKAIEYYESINDPKFLIYNQALNFLFEQPEAKKFMEGKDLAKEFRKKEIMKKFKQCEKIVTEEKVKSFMEKRTNEENIKKSIDTLYNGDMDKQKNNFKKKMEEKRLKYQNKKVEKENSKNLENSNNEKEKENKENINSINNDKESNKNDNYNNKSENDDKGNELKEPKINDDEFKLGEDKELMELENDGEEQEEISDIDFNIDDVVELINIAKKESKDNIDNKGKKEDKENKDSGEDNKVTNNNNIKDKDKDKNKDIKEEQKSKSSNNTYSLKQSIKLTNKTRFFEKLKDNFNVYFDGYYEYYMKNVIDTIIKDFEDNEAEVTKQVCDSGVNYLNQIKDMEYLLDNKDTEESYRKELGNIIKQLTEERQSIVDKIISENEAKIKKIGNKYSVNNSILKEKFKLDTTKLINSFIFK